LALFYTKSERSTILPYRRWQNPALGPAWLTQRAF